MLNVHINNVPAVALADTGSDFSIISLDWLQQHNLSSQMDPYIRSTVAADGGTVCTIGTVSLPVNVVGEHGTTVLFRVLPSALHPVILGIDFARETERPLTCGTTLNGGGEVCSFKGEIGTAPNSWRPQVLIWVRETQIPCLIDTGASFSVMSRATWQELTRNAQPFQPAPAPNCQLISAGGAPLQQVDCVYVPFTIHNAFFVHRFIIMQQLSSQVILGVDFLNLHQATITCTAGGSSLSLAASPVLTKKKFSLQPGQEKLVQAKASLPKDRDAIFTATHNNTSDAITSVSSDSDVVVRVFNDTPEAVTFNRGTPLGTAIPARQNPSWHKMTPAQPLPPRLRAAICPVEPASETAARPRPPASQERLDQIRTRAIIKAPQPWRARYLNLLLEFQDVFSLNDLDIGQTSAMQHHIQLKDDTPVHIKQFRIPLKQQQFISKKVQQYQQLGILERSTSAYNTPIFAIPKKTAPGVEPQFRLLQDLRGLNRVSQPDRHSTPTVRDCIDRIGQMKAKVFSALDLRSGYFQMQLAPDSRHLTSFTIPGEGKFQWKVTTMGLTGAPASFAKLMETVMMDMANVLVYLDDCLACSTTHQKHLTHLRKCLQRLRQYGLTLNIDKSEFGCPSVQYLGHTVSGSGFSVGKANVQAIAEFPEPNTKKKVQQFIGLANFYRQLIPNFALIAGPLNKLAAEASPWTKGPLPADCLKAFHTLRNLLTKEPVVTFPNPNLPFTLQCDASATTETSNGGLGAVLSQQVQGKRHIVACASRALRQNELNYSPYLLELLAVTWAIEHFQEYLQHNEFTVETDHAPVEKLSKAHTKTLHRLQEIMNQFPCTIRYTPGSLNGAADALSRNPTGTGISSLNAVPSIVAAQSADPTWQQVRQYVGKGILPQDRTAYIIVRAHGHLLHLQQQVLVRHDRHHGQQVVLPRQLREQVLQRLHAGKIAGHMGITKTAQRILQEFWWPGLYKDVAEFVSKCKTCLHTTNPAGFLSTHPPMRPLQPPSHPNVRVHADLYGPLNPSSNGNRWILVVTDAFSKLGMFIPTPTKEAPVIAAALMRHWISIMGPMKILLTDQGREFRNKLLNDVCQLLGVDKRLTPAMAPNVNGQAEQLNRFVTSYLKKATFEDPKMDWEEQLPVMQLAYNTATHSATGESPIRIHFGVEPSSPIFQDQPEKPPEHMHKSAEQIWQHFRSNTERLQQAAKAMKDRQKPGSVRNQSFLPNSPVLVYFPHSSFTGKGLNAKFQANWIPATITSRIGHHTYRVKLPSGNPSLVSADRLRALPATAATPPATAPGPPPPPPPPPPPSTAAPTGRPQHQRAQRPLPQHNPGLPAPPQRGPDPPAPPQQRKPHPARSHHMTTRLQQRRMAAEPIRQAIAMLRRSAEESSRTRKKKKRKARRKPRPLESPQQPWGAWTWARSQQPPPPPSPSSVASGPRSPPTSPAAGPSVPRETPARPRSPTVLTRFRRRLQQQQLLPGLQPDFFKRKKKPARRPRQQTGEVPPPLMMPESQAQQQGSRSPSELNPFLSLRIKPRGPPRSPAFERSPAEEQVQLRLHDQQQHHGLQPPATPTRHQPLQPPLTPVKAPTPAAAAADHGHRRPGQQLDFSTPQFQEHRSPASPSPQESDEEATDDPDNP